MSFQVKALRTGCPALRVAGRATVFASFERSCYVETSDGIGCIGDGIGLGPLNILVERFVQLPVGSAVDIFVGASKVWTPRVPGALPALPKQKTPASIRKPANAFLGWIAGKGEPDDALIGLGSGLTPAGDDFVGGAMIALRAYGHQALADRVAAWSLPLAKDRSSRISRAHLECAAEGEGHEALHDLLCTGDAKHLERLAGIGHTSGLDAAAGALLSLGLVGEARRDAPEARE
jgi:hypothetical protein